MAANSTALAVKRILVVEDDWFIVKGLVRDLRNAGADVLGPAPSISDALALLRTDPPDGAVLDVKLRGEMAFPVADALAGRGSPWPTRTSCQATRAACPSGSCRPLPAPHPFVI